MSDLKARQRSMPGMDEWLKTRPECVQKLAAEFPVGDTVEIDGEPDHFVIGYTEDDKLIVTPIWPGDDYEAAMEARAYVCAHHYRSN